MPPDSVKAQLFADADYGGASATLDKGYYNIGDSTGSAKNDTVSSLKVESGYQVTLYAERDGKGASKAFLTDTPRLEGFSGTVSSVSVRVVTRGSGSQFAALMKPPSGWKPAEFVEPPG